MRTIICEAWKDAIDEAVRREFPNFEPLTKRARSEPRGMLKYQWHPQERLWCYIAFRPLDDDAFDAFVGWSMLDQFPIGSGLQLDKVQDILDFEAPFVLAWSMQLVPRAGAAHWSFWNPPANLSDDPEEFGRAFAEYYAQQLTYVDARKLIEPAVAAGIAEVRDYGIPYLQKRVAYKPKS